MRVETASRALCRDFQALEFQNSAPELVSWFAMRSCRCSRGRTLSSTRYNLTLDVTERDVVVTGLRGQVVNRQRYILNVVYELTDLGKGKALTQGTSNSQVGYDTVRQPISDLQARNAAMRRASIEVGQDIKLRLAAYLSR